MKDLYDTLFAPNRFGRDKWNESEPDFDEIFEWESDDPKESDGEDDLSLEEWLES
jgi:hypothetical protein